MLRVAAAASAGLSYRRGVPRRAPALGEQHDRGMASAGGRGIGCRRRRIIRRRIAGRTASRSGTATATIKGADDETLPFTPFAEIKPGLDANDFVEGLLASSSLVVVYGAPGSGKTFWVLDLCLHVAAGRLWRGRAVERGAAILLALEGGSGVRNRIAAARARMHLPYTTPLVMEQCPVDRCRAEADVAKVVATVRLIAARLDVPVRMLVVDIFRRTCRRQ